MLGAAIPADLIRATLPAARTLTLPGITAGSLTWNFHGSKCRPLALGTATGDPAAWCHGYCSRGTKGGSSPMYYWALKTATQPFEQFG